VIAVSALGIEGARDPAGASRPEAIFRPVFQIADRRGTVLN